MGPLTGLATITTVLTVVLVAASSASAFGPSSRG